MKTLTIIMLLALNLQAQEANRDSKYALIASGVLFVAGSIFKLQSNAYINNSTPDYSALGLDARRLHNDAMVNNSTLKRRYNNLSNACFTGALTSLVISFTIKF